MEKLENFCDEENLECMGKTVDEIEEMINMVMIRELMEFGRKGKNLRIPTEWLDIIYVVYPTLIKKLSKECLEPYILEIDLRKKICNPDCNIFMQNNKCYGKSIIMTKLVDKYANNYRHQVLLFVDIINKTIEYFDSVGDTYGIDILKKYVDSTEWNIITTLDFCPKNLSPQFRTQDIFCASWSLLYIYLRSKYQLLPIQDIWDNLINLSTSNLSYTIHGFILYLIDIIKSWHLDYKYINNIIKKNDDLAMFSYNIYLSNNLF